MPITLILYCCLSESHPLTRFQSSKGFSFLFQVSLVDKPSIYCRKIKNLLCYLRDIFFLWMDLILYCVMIMISCVKKVMKMLVKHVSIVTVANWNFQMWFSKIVWTLICSVMCIIESTCTSTLHYILILKLNDSTRVSRQHIAYQTGF